MADLKFAIVTCSDTRSIEQDTAGAALESLIAENGWTCASRVIVKDERADIAEAIVVGQGGTEKRGRKMWEGGGRLPGYN